ncbi:MAG: glutathione peroxidase [Bdellovibrionia bacterium]
MKLLHSILIRFGVLCSLISASAVAFQAQAAESEIYSKKLLSLEGESQTLKPYRGKVLLIVNTASQCGYTPQYAGLQKLYTQFKSQGLVVLGFPSNDFGGQEPGSSQQIRFFCQTKYAVEFPLFAKGPVSGPSIQPLFQWLLKQSPSSEPIAWNFEKFLVSREGKVLARFKSEITPDHPDLLLALEQALKQSERKSSHGKS